MSYSPTSPPVPVSTQYPVYLFPPMPPTASLMEMIPTMPPMPHLTMPPMPPMPHLMMPDLTMPPVPNLSSLTVPPQVTSKMFSFFLPSSAPAPSPTGAQAGREPYAPSSPFPVSLPPGNSPQYVGDCSLLNNYPPQCAGTSTCKYVTSWNKCVAKI